MKKYFGKMMMTAVVVLGMGMAAGCEKESATGDNAGGKKDYYYNLYTDSQNLNGSVFDEFQPLWDGDMTIMYQIYDTREEADKEALRRFDEILAQIDDSKACAGLNGDDYMTATMQRVEGGPHDLKSKTWTANGTIEIGK